MPKIQKYFYLQYYIKNAVLDKYNLKTSYLPDVVREYILGYAGLHYRSEAERKLKDKIRETKKLINDIDKDKAPRTGEMAQFLARDIIFHKPLNAENKGKPNNVQYDVLQGLYAMFVLEKNNILKFHNELQLVGKQNEFTHPFLYKVQLKECRGILDFYKSYLQKKKTWLEKGLKSSTSNDYNEDTFKIEYGHALKIKIRKGLPKEYIHEHDSPVVLPRGLFNEAIAAGLQNEGFDIKSDDNLVYSLDKYLKGDTQPYYDMKRFYFHNEEYDGRSDYKEIIENLKNELQKLKDEPEPKNDEEKRKRAFAIKDLAKEVNRIYGREQLIRYTQSNDRALWLMFMELAKKEEAAEYEFVNINLKNVYYSNEEKESESILNRNIPMKCKIFDKVITDNLPLKRYGEFRAELKDRRMENLLKYYKDDEINHSLLKEDLELYNRGREDLFEKIYQFEEVALDSDLKDDLLEKKKDGFVAHRDIIEIIMNHFSDFSFDLGLKDVIELRNRFNHNQIPYKPKLSELIKQEESEPVTPKLFDLANMVYDELIQKLKN